jgi:hypothetical protein
MLVREVLPLGHQLLPSKLLCAPTDQLPGRIRTCPPRFCNGQMSVDHPRVTGPDSPWCMCFSFRILGDFPDDNELRQQHLHCFPLRTPLIMSMNSPLTTARNRSVDLGLNTEEVSSFAVKNTKKVYDCVKQEWTDFCQFITDDNDFPSFMNAEKVSDFMLYQCF